MPHASDPAEERSTTVRRSALRMQQPLDRFTVFDRVAFLIGTVAAVWLATLLVLQGFRTWWGLGLALVVWALLAYLALPRLHKMLSDLYVPDYFFGRTRTADGLLGDPVNLAVDGSFEQLDAVMRRAGWHTADEISPSSTWGIIVSTLTRRSYPTAPVSNLYLFGRRQDVAYQQEVAGNPKQRHHVRFWHTPPGWPLPGGARVDWLGAGTYDTDVGLSLFTLQITHRIDEDTDVERDFVVSSATTADDSVRVRVLSDFTTGYHSRNGGGDRFITDGDLPILDLSEVEPSLTDTTLTASYVAEKRARPPMTTIFGAVVVLVGAVLSGLDIVNALVDTAGLDEIEIAALWIVLGVFALALVIQIVLAISMLRGGRRARNTLIVLLTITIIGAAVSYLDGTIALGLDFALLNATVQCLGLLALTTDSAGAWSRRRLTDDLEPAPHEAPAS